MTGFPDTVGRNIILQHFPKADPAIIDRHAVWLSPPLVGSLPPYNFVKEGEEVEAKIEAFQRAIGDAWRAYHSLPLHVRRGNGIEWASFAKLARAASGVAHPGEKAIRPSAIEIMRRNARNADRLSAQAMKAEHPAKIALVENARAAWRDLSGKEAPFKPSEKRTAVKGEPVFLQFVEDIILGAGKSWGAEKALAAWRTAETKFAK